MVTFSLCAQRFGMSGNASLGPAKIMLLLIGIAAILFGALRRGSWSWKVFTRFGLVVFSVYSTLLAGEVIVAIVSPHARSDSNAAASLKGMFRLSNSTGFDLTPNWRGTFDDGVVKAQIAINSLSARDDEPSEEKSGKAITRILLIGDSFTFGYCLNQSETIDKQIERLSKQSVDAYNIGVNGYGPGEILEKLRSTKWWSGSDVFYLFFCNDLRDDNYRPGQYTVYAGHVVPKFHSNGEPYVEQQYRNMISAASRNGSFQGDGREYGKLIKSLLLLDRLRRRTAILLGSDDGLLDGSAHRYNLKYIEKVVEYTRMMKEVAGSRGSMFHTVIVPSKGETAFRRYASFTQAYVDQVRAAGIDVIELRDRLSPKDYFPHDGHFNPDGAAVAARVILESLNQ